MARLIDADELREDWLENGENEYVYNTNDFLDSIDAQPTVDALEVVRCKECFNRGNVYKCPMCCEETFYDKDDGMNIYLEDNTEDDGFCHRGIRYNDK